MANNAFSKEERVAFENILEGFDDQLVLSKNVTVYNTDQTMMERTGDVIWRPMPYVARSFDGADQTANFLSQTQLSVPATIGYDKSSPWTMTARELRDRLQEGRLGDSARQKLASDINLSVLTVAANYGTNFVKRTTAATGFDDLALADAMMTEIGVQPGDRYAGINPRDYIGMASNLAGRQTMHGKPLTAYEKAYIGEVSTFETYKMDYTVRKTAAAGGAGITMSTLDAAANYYVPLATRTAVTGERSNIDNRFQTITVSSTTNVAAGDAFTVATLDSVHLITKEDTGQLKTFRVISVDSATTMTISPPMITGQGGSQAELQYKNCNINTKASNSALVFLNTATAGYNVFWHKDAIELMPGRLALDPSAGASIMRGSTDQGIEVVMQKQYDIDVRLYKYRIDAIWGVNMLQPEMAGSILFNQA